MTGTRKHPGVTWVNRSFEPGNADSFGVSSLQNSLDALSEAAPFVGATVAFAPSPGDLWVNPTTGAIQVYAGGVWKAAVVVATPPVVTGSRGGNAALGSLLAALAALGLLTNATTA